jgi:hypothetical protein
MGMASESCSYTILTLGPAPYQNHWGPPLPAVSKLKHVKIQYHLPLRIFLQIVTTEISGEGPRVQET